MPVPYCVDDCGFVVEPEDKQVDFSSSILLSQDCFGYSRFFWISIQIVKLFVLDLSKQVVCKGGQFLGKQASTNVVSICPLHCGLGASP